MNYHKELQEIANGFLAEETDRLNLTRLAKRYKSLLIELSNIDLSQQDLKTDLVFDNGKAIGTAWAASCVDDAIRTQKFLLGLFDAINYLKPQKKGPIHILYAGTGPFATLVLPILTLFSAQEIQLSLIEINKHSFDSMKGIFSILDLNGFIRTAENEDATTYTIKSGEKIDIFLSETMQHALREEQQVAITLNLLNQLGKEVILIPERVILDFGLLNLHGPIGDKEDKESLKKIARVFELSQTEIHTFIDNNSADGDQVQFSKIRVHIPKSLQESFSFLAIFTDIQVFGKHWIKTNESGLTTPFILGDLASLEHLENLTATFQYKIDGGPDMVYSFSALSNTNFPS